MTEVPLHDVAARDRALATRLGAAASPGDYGFDLGTSEAATHQHGPVLRTTEAGAEG